MTKRFLLPGLFAGLALAALALVPAKADRIDKAAKPTAAKLVEQLGSDSFNVRKKAYEQLEALGAPALEELRKAMASKDVEVSKKAKELVGKIEKQVAAAAVLSSKVVQLTYKDTPIKDAVADLKKKTGYLIVLHDPDNKLKDKKVTLDTGKVTFWVAMEKFCEAAGVVEGDPNADRMNNPIGVPGGPGGRPRPGGVQILPVRPGVQIQPAKKIQVAPPAKGQAEKPPQTDPAKPEAPDENAETKAKKQAEIEAKKAEIMKRLEALKEQAKANAAQAKPGQAPPGAGGPAILPIGPGGPGGPPGGNMKPWVPVQQGQITLIPGKAKKQDAEQKTTLRLRAGSHPSLSAQDKQYLAVLEVSVEPKVRWQSFSEIKITKAIDANGDTLKQAEEKAPERGGGGIGGFPGGPGGPGGPAIMPGGPGGGIAAPGFPGGKWVYIPQSNNGLSHYVPVRLEKGAKAAKSLKELTGTLSAKLLGEAEQLIVVENLLKAKGKAVKGKSGGEINIIDATKDANGNVKITFEFEPAADVVAETMIQGDAVEMKPLPGNPGVGRPGVRPLPPVKGGAAGGAGGGNAAGGAAGNKAAREAADKDAAETAKKAEAEKKAAQEKPAVAEDTPAHVQVQVQVQGNNVAVQKVQVANGQVQVIVVPAGGQGGGGGVVVGGPGMTTTSTRYAPYGLTLVDAKGKVLPAAIQLNFEKLRQGGGRIQFKPGQKMEYIATYRPTGKDAPEPAKLVYTGRKSVDATVPFTLKNVDIK